MGKDKKPGGKKNKKETVKKDDKFKSLKNINKKIDLTSVRSPKTPGKTDPKAEAKAEGKGDEKEDRKEEAKVEAKEEAKGEAPVDAPADAKPKTPGSPTGEKAPEVVGIKTPGKLKITEKSMKKKNIKMPNLFDKFQIDKIKGKGKGKGKAKVSRQATPEARKDTLRKDIEAVLTNMRLAADIPKDLKVKMADKVLEALVVLKLPSKEMKKMEFEILEKLVKIETQQTNNFKKIKEAALKIPEVKRAKSAFGGWDSDELKPKKSISLRSQKKVLEKRKSAGTLKKKSSDFGFTTSDGPVKKMKSGKKLSPIKSDDDYLKAKQKAKQKESPEEMIRIRTKSSKRDLDLVEFRRKSEKSGKKLTLRKDSDKIKINAKHDLKLVPLINNQLFPNQTDTERTASKKKPDFASPMNDTFTRKKSEKSRKTVKTIKEKVVEQKKAEKEKPEESKTKIAKLSPPAEPEVRPNVDADGKMTPGKIASEINAAPSKQDFPTIIVPILLNNTPGYNQPNANELIQQQLQNMKSPKKDPNTSKEKKKSKQMQGIQDLIQNLQQMQQRQTPATSPGLPQQHVIVQQMPRMMSPQMHPQQMMVQQMHPQQMMGQPMMQMGQPMMMHPQMMHPQMMKGQQMFRYPMHRPGLPQYRFSPQQQMMRDPRVQADAPDAGAPSPPEEQAKEETKKSTKEEEAKEETKKSTKEEAKEPTKEEPKEPTKEEPKEAKQMGAEVEISKKTGELVQVPSTKTVRDLMKIKQEIKDDALGQGFPPSGLMPPIEVSKKTVDKSWKQPADQKKDGRQETPSMLKRAISPKDQIESEIGSEISFSQVKAHAKHNVAALTFKPQFKSNMTPYATRQILSNETADQVEMNWIERNRSSRLYRRPVEFRQIRGEDLKYFKAHLGVPPHRVYDDVNLETLVLMDQSEDKVTFRKGKNRKKTL